MRQSLSKFIDTCFDIKVHLEVSSYDLHANDDGAYAVFKTATIKDPKTLINIIGKLDCTIYEENRDVCLCVYEDYSDY